MATKKPNYHSTLKNRKKHKSLRGYPEGTPNELAEFMAEQLAEKDADEDLDNLLLLLDYYEISRTDKQRWFYLCHELACEFIPAFKQENARRGRKKRTYSEELELYKKVSTYRGLHPKKNMLQACEYVIQQNGLKGKNGIDSMKPITLSDLCKKVKKRLKEQK